MRFMIFNGSLKKPELSNTYAVCEMVQAQFNNLGAETRIVTMNEIDYECGTDDYNDELKPIILDFLKNYDGMIFATPIWWGLHSGYISSVIERFDYIDGWSRDNNFYPNYNKVFGCVVSGGGDGFQHINGMMFNFATQLGFTIPPRAYVESKAQGRDQITKDQDTLDQVQRFCQNMFVYATLIRGTEPGRYAQHKQIDK